MPLARGRSSRHDTPSSSPPAYRRKRHDTPSPSPENYQDCASNKNKRVRTTTTTHEDDNGRFDRRISITRSILVALACAPILVVEDMFFAFNLSEYCRYLPILLPTLKYSFRKNMSLRSSRSCLSGKPRFLATLLLITGGVIPHNQHHQRPSTLSWGHDDIIETTQVKLYSSATIAADLRSESQGSLALFSRRILEKNM